jgi:hypothetical protein
MSRPPLTQALTAVMSCRGVMVKVCPKEAAASWDRFFFEQKVFLLHQMLPLSPVRSIPVRAVRLASGEGEVGKRDEFRLWPEDELVEGVAIDGRGAGQSSLSLLFAVGCCIARFECGFPRFDGARHAYGPTAFEL